MKLKDIVYAAIAEDYSSANNIFGSELVKRIEDKLEEKKKELVEVNWANVAMAGAAIAPQIPGMAKSAMGMFGGVQKFRRDSKFGNAYDTLKQHSKRGKRPDDVALINFIETNNLGVEQSRFIGKYEADFLLNFLEDKNNDHATRLNVEKLLGKSEDDYKNAFSLIFRYYKGTGKTNLSQAFLSDHRRYQAKISTMNQNSAEDATMSYDGASVPTDDDIFGEEYLTERGWMSNMARSAMVDPSRFNTQSAGLSTAMDSAVSMGRDIKKSYDTLSSSKFKNAAEKRERIKRNVQSIKIAADQSSRNPNGEVDLDFGSRKSYTVKASISNLTADWIQNFYLAGNEFGSLSGQKPTTKSAARKELISNLDSAEAFSRFLENSERKIKNNGTHNTDPWRQRFGLGQSEKFLKAMNKDGIIMTPRDAKETIDDPLKQKEREREYEIQGQQGFGGFG